MLYQIPEGSVQLAGEWQDRSVNVLVPLNTTSTGANLVIARDSMPRGLSFADYLHRERKSFEKQLPEFRLHADAPATTCQGQAHNLEFTWTNQGKAMRQLMTVVANGESVLSITATIPNGCEDATEILRTAMKSLTVAPDFGIAA
jgi:hypothetical protein